MILRTGSRFYGAARGFTLIEVLMAISILAVGTVGVLRAYSLSINAMEIAQYNVDASCLLKAVMGETEEAFIVQRGTPVGASSGEITSSSSIKMDTGRSGRWLWDREVSETGLQVKVPDEAANDDEADEGSEGQEKKDKKTIYSLNEVKITVMNPGRSPSRNIDLVTYMESQSAEG